MILLTGDAEEQLSDMHGNTFQCCVTSPPYFGLRDYKQPGQIGLEVTPELYIKSLSRVFREVWRVLRSDGTLWLNLGDSYARDARKGQHKPGDTGKQAYIYDSGGGRASSMMELNEESDIKPKELLGIPWRVAFALQSWGWYLRSDIIWAKPNPMPESVTDRPTRSHEYLFLLTKSKNYYYNHEAVKEPAVCDRIRGPANHRDTEMTNGNSGLGRRARERNARDSFKRIGSKREEVHPVQNTGTHRPERQEDSWDITKRNLRDVWTINTKPYRGAHFAVFPEALVEPCILAGSQPGDLILDPFMGSGTVGVVCARLDRIFTGIDLNPDYVTLAESRISSVQPG